MGYAQTVDFDNLKIESPIWRAVRQSPDGYQFIDTEAIGATARDAIEYAKWIEEKRPAPSYYAANPVVGAIKTVMTIEV